MKQKKITVGNEFSSRLYSGEWDRKMHARVESERKDRIHIRIRIMALASIVFIGAFAVTATWWEEDATGNNLYTSIEEASGGLQMKVSFTE
ncbi:MAG: hypothetical protein J0L53_16410 [Spirochaetes bacterium]|nr:hypothetical protein [Spirochaetota bacterium]MBX3723694.1 hypothetical protein [Turneriella sp.]